MVAVIENCWRQLDKYRCILPERNLLKKEGRWSVFLFSLVLFMAALYLRSGETIAVPSLFVEDATHYFNKYYGGFRPIETILSKPHGYFNIFNNFIAWLTSFCDVRVQPSVYVIVALLLSATAILLPSFTGIIQNKWLLFCLPFLLGLSGFNHIFYFTTITYQMYVVVLPLLILLLLPAPKYYITLVLQCLLAAVLIFSGPYSVVAVPASILLLLFFKRDVKKQILWVTVICTTVYYASFSGGLAEFGNLLEFSIVLKMISSMVFDVFFLRLASGNLWLFTSILLMFLTAVFYLLRTDRFFYCMGIVLLGIVCSAMAPFFLSSKFAVYHSPSKCHVFISQFFWLFFLVFTCERLLRNDLLNKRMAPSLVILFIGLIWYDNFKHQTKWSYNTNPEIKTFLNRIHRAESMGLKAKNQYTVIMASGVVVRPFVPRVRVGSRGRSAQLVEIEDTEM